MHRFMTSSSKYIRALRLTLLISMRSVNIHIHIWNIHTLNSLCILGKHVVMHYTDLCGQDHLDKVGEKCTRRRKRTYIQAWDPELGLQKRQCSHSTSGSVWQSANEKPGFKTQQRKFWARGYWGTGPRYHPRGWNKAILINAKIQHLFRLLILWVSRHDDGKCHNIYGKKSME